MEPFAIEVRSTTYIIRENVAEACFRLQKTDDEGQIRKPPSPAAELLRRRGFDADFCLDGAVWFGGYVGRSIHAGERILKVLEDLIEPGGIAAWIDTEGHSYVDRFDGRQMVREDPYEQYMNLKPAHELQGNDLRAWCQNKHPCSNMFLYLARGLSFGDIV